jgi:two-component system chemotaxis response regulator CheB
VIRVLVVDDSPTVREFLMHLLGSDPEIEVVGSASDGEEALEAVNRVKPDVVTMDIRMPGIDGFEATRLIMETSPTPIVVVSGNLDPEEAASFRAIEAGALAVLQRPPGIGHPDHAATMIELVRTVKLMSEVKVVKRWPHARKHITTPAASISPQIALNGGHSGARVIAMGASTGGPIVLRQILSILPKQFSVPILIVQHIAAGFVGSFTEWLGQSSGFPVLEARHGDLLLPGHAYVAPDGCHMGVSTVDRIALSRIAPENGMRPSVAYLFRSIALVFGKSAVGVLLTGMGKDGAVELKTMKEKGAVTIAQDKESSLIHGMPGEAIKINAATYVLPPEEIAGAMARFARKAATDSLSEC